MSATRTAPAPHLISSLIPAGGGGLHAVQVCDGPVWGCYRVWCATCGVLTREPLTHLNEHDRALARALGAEAPERHR